MPTMTSPRRESTAYRNNTSNDVQRHYREYSRSAAVRSYDYPQSIPTYRPYKPVPFPGSKEAKEKAVQSSPKIKKRGISISKANLVKLYLKIGFVFLMCCIMIYRYAIILEANDTITKMTEQAAEIEAGNQAIQFKIERGLELGALEEYATTELGMMRPDSSQIFYIDMQLGDETVSENASAEEETMVKGTPGALVHAIKVLK